MAAVSAKAQQRKRKVPDSTDAKACKVSKSGKESALVNLKCLLAGLLARNDTGTTATSGSTFTQAEGDKLKSTKCVRRKQRLRANKLYESMPLPLVEVIIGIEHKGLRECLKTMWEFSHKVETEKLKEIFSTMVKTVLYFRQTEKLKETRCKDVSGKVPDSTDAKACKFSKSGKESAARNDTGTTATSGSTFTQGEGDKLK